MAADFPRLLIAEDMWMNTFLLWNKLPKEKIEIVWVKNGEEALKALNGESFDGVVLKNPSFFEPPNTAQIGSIHFKAAILDNNMGLGMKGIEVYQLVSSKVNAFMFSADDINTIKREAKMPEETDVKFIKGQKPHANQDDLNSICESMGVVLEEKKIVQPQQNQVESSSVNTELKRAEVDVLKAQIAEKEIQLKKLESEGRAGKLQHTTILRYLETARARLNSLQSSQP